MYLSSDYYSTPLLNLRLRLTKTTTATTATTGATKEEE